MMTGIHVQHRSEPMFTFDRNGRSRWAGTRSQIDDVSIVPPDQPNEVQYEA
jgi:hypothetical protein